MTTTKTVWRSVKTDPPKPEDYPVIAGWHDDTGYQEVVYARPDAFPLTVKSKTHWRSIKCAPPPREQTQREKDEEAFKAWYKSEAHRADADIPFSDVWHAALAWEREAVVEELIEHMGRNGYRTATVIHDCIRDFFRARREGGLTK